MPGLSKFDELRRKTGNELLKLLNDDLDLGLAAARDALKPANDAAAKRSYTQAKRAHAEASRLLPLAYEIADEERIGLQLRLNRLSLMIEALGDEDEHKVALAGVGEC